MTSDRPIQGMNRYGRPYTAYRVKTRAGAEQMYFPSARAIEELQRQRVRRGSVLEIRGSRQESREGLAVTRYDIVAVRDGEAPHANTPSTSNPDDLRVLRCVALKAAAGTRSTTGEPPDVLATANAYFDWLTRP